MKNQQNTDTDTEVKVWDIAVRICHWSLVLFFSIAYISPELSEDVHVLAGYIVGGLLVFRLLWGLIGTHYARFSQFIYNKQRVKQYLHGFIRARPEHYYGHNPAGGWAVVFMLIMLLLISYTGLELLATEGEGPLAQHDVSLVQVAHADDNEDDASEHAESSQHEMWEEAHELVSNVMLLFVLFHILAVVVSSGLHKENLIKAMFTGRKKKVAQSADQ